MKNVKYFILFNTKSLSLLITNSENKFYYKSNALKNVIISIKLNESK